MQFKLEKQGCQISIRRRCSNCPTAGFTSEHMVGIKDEGVKAEFQNLVSTDNLPDLLKREVRRFSPSILYTYLPLLLSNMFLCKADSSFFFLCKSYQALC
jgi:hypothetical protein